MAEVDWSKKSWATGSLEWAEGADIVDWAKIKVPAVVWSKQALSDVTLQRTQTEVDAWRKSVDITIVNSTCPPPILTFEEAAMFIPTQVVASFKKQNFIAPTPIQSQSWSAGLTNRDVVGIAKTGSGKTLAFLIPGIAHILAQPPQEPGDGPMMLVLAPTRELAKQIDDECAKVVDGSGIKTVCAYGGTEKSKQMRKLRDGAHIAICCPGRLIDLLSDRYSPTNLYRTSYLVLDEADRMLDMGFEPQIRMICNQCQPDRQTMMFSATWPTEVQGLAETFQKRFVRLHVGSLELTTNPSVKQTVFVVRDYDKVDKLMEIVAQRTYKKFLVFVGSKDAVENVCGKIREQKILTFSIHGDKTQGERDQALEQFRNASGFAALVATDVAQRGLDIRDLNAVINFDFPRTLEDYVHRVGRTGRAGATGDAISFINQRSGGLAGDLVAMFRKAGTDVSPELAELAMRGGGSRPSFSRAVVLPPPPPPSRRERSRTPPRRRSRSRSRRRRSESPPARRRRRSNSR